MARKYINTVKLGIFIILAFILFVYGLYRIGGRQSFLTNHMTIYVDFKDVKGLRPGNNVRYSGITIGSVEEIDIQNDTTLRVRLAVEQEAGNYLRKNARAEIGSNGLVGNMLVNIRPGSGTADPVSPGDILLTTRSVEMNEMVDLLAASNQRIVQITEQLLQITGKINEGQGSMAMMLNDEQMAVHLRESVERMAATSSSIYTASRSLAEFTEQVNSGQGNLGYLLRDTSLKTQMARLSDSLDTLVTVRTEPVLDSLEFLVSSLTGASRSVQHLLDGLNEGEGLLGTLLADSSLTQELQVTLQNLERGTYKFDQNMEALQHSWPFKKFFRKKAQEQKD